MSRGYLFFVIFGLITPITVSKHVQFYRKDYTYIEQYDAFYKVHWDTAGFSWSSAFLACDDEGSKLFFPSGDEWTVVKKLVDAMPIAPNTSEIYVGLHDDFKLGEFITIDGKSTDSPLGADEKIITTTSDERCMILDYLTGMFRVTDCYGNRTEKPLKPFVCKRIDDESCPTIDNGNKFENSYFRAWYNADRYNVDRYTDMDCGIMIYNQQTSMQVENCYTQLPFICEMMAK